MKKVLVVLVFVSYFFGCQNAENKNGSVINYDVSFPNVAHNEAEVTVTITNLDPTPVQFTMSRTSPGRYALHEFAKNVYNVVATDSEGDTLEINRPNLHNWIVSRHDGTINFQYTLYANRADGTYSGINREHAHLNMPATFVWVQGYETKPIVINFDVPQGSGWNVATQLKPTDDTYTYRAPDTYYFLDSPTELSDFTMNTWEVTARDTAYTMRLALHHQDTDESVQKFVKMTQQVVEEQHAMFGNIPGFDFGTYTFIADYLPYVEGDGMEHRNSTILTSPRSLEEDALRNLLTLSHEYFHVWNVERIRPASLEPFDFQQANMSKVLWFGEGFTSYYDDLFIRRAGLISNKGYAVGLASTINSVYLAPGSRFYSPVEMSMQAPFVDAATSIDPQNKANTFISYYSWGAAIGLGLDLMLRTTFEGVSLDDYMRQMWREFGRSEIPYTLVDLEQTLAEVTDSTQFARQFFKRHIYGKQLIKLKPLLAEAGFVLQKENTGRAVIDWGENKISFEQGEAKVVKNTLVGSPLYEAGIDRGDTIHSIGDQKLTNGRILHQAILTYEPGDTTGITYESLGKIYKTDLVFIEDPTLEVVPFETVGREVTPGIQELRESWLGSKVE